MDRDRRYGWGYEDRGHEEDRGGRNLGSRDREDEWRQRGGSFAGRDREEETPMGRGSYGEIRDDEWRRGRDFGMSGQAGRGTEGGGYSSREWERDRDRYESSRSRGYGQMGMGNQGGWGSSRGMSGYGQQSSRQGSYGSTGTGDQGSQGYGSQGHGSQGHGDTSREAGPYGASPSSYGGGMPGYGSGTSGYDTTRYGTSGRGAGAYTAGGWPYSQGGPSGPSGYGTSMRGNLGYGASSPSGREWERPERDRGEWERERGGSWTSEEHREGGGMLHRMGEGLRNMFGVERGERGPFFGRGAKGYKRSDERVREEVCEVIARQGYIDASDVEVRVQGGEVTLSGQVRDREHKRRLEQMIEDLPGVDDVKNEIRVQRIDVSQAQMGRTNLTTASATGAPTGTAPQVSSTEENGTRGGRTRTS